MIRAAFSTTTVVQFSFVTVTADTADTADTANIVTDIVTDIVTATVNFEKFTK